MKITFTDSAIERITPFLGENQGVIKLVFDTEDCGCSVNGVPTLWIVMAAESGDLRADAEPFQLVYKPKDEIFFEESMKVDYHPGNKSFILKSNNQIYNAHMNLIDKR
ncbi:iron-sulfur cluster biosynthesis family protein [Paenibacillus sp. SYP-B3998]|uniref:Iron-sulfur cluster biosynthesis family protein n=1 Tax=Paenibacillus sp. SYP-B3998 TaxID=2678564 RepID=A0A6G3ZXJ4_9BACL|nr:iron-sulfur cluster biosynthesis family protein [Paenibacillus sp. SYP-B3998]NEW06424.1 iron-sulfur cluster biosynthesis family protein [Paenibacillus sp. SYP-B3998]